MRRALIPEITGQDGVNLAEFLLGKGHEVHGIKQCASLFGMSQIDHIHRDPHESGARFNRASTSELYDLVRETLKSGITPFHPRPPYAIRKRYVYWSTIKYKGACCAYACNDILFDQDSPVRSENFVSRKITLALTRMKLGLRERLYLGNLNVLRDCWRVHDDVKMQWMMLRQGEPGDFVIATGIKRTLRDFIDVTAAQLDMVIYWRGVCLGERGYGQGGSCFIEVDPCYFRSAEVELLSEDALGARKRLRWTPRTTFEEPLAEMAGKDLCSVQRDELVQRNGFHTNQLHE